MSIPVSSSSSKGFTLIEILVVMGMLAVLSSVVLVAVNPLRQFAQARNTQRSANVAAVLNAIGNRIADNRGLFEGNNDGCHLPTTASIIANETLDSPTADIRRCLVPDYISDLPVDPAKGRSTCITPTCIQEDEIYDTQYTVAQDATTQRITVCAPASVEPALGTTKPICISR